MEDKELFIQPSEEEILPQVSGFLRRGLDSRTGGLVVIHGPTMVSNKTKVGIAAFIDFKGDKLALKPRRDDRWDVASIKSHNKNSPSMPAEPHVEFAKVVKRIQDRLNPGGLAFIDELMLFEDESDKSVDGIEGLVTAGCQVLVTGVDIQFNGKPFPPMLEVIELALRPDIRGIEFCLTTACDSCGSNRAYISERSGIDGQPASYFAASIDVGDHYTPTCLTCWRCPDLPSDFKVSWVPGIEKKSIFGEISQ